MSMLSTETGSWGTNLWPIDSCLFENIPNGGWKRRSKECASTSILRGNACDVISSQTPELRKPVSTLKETLHLETSD